MDPYSMAGLGSDLVGGLVGMFGSAGDRERARQARQAGLDQFLNINAPSIAEESLDLTPYKVAGTYNPQMESTVSQGPSNFNNIRVNPALHDAQDAALSELEGIGHSGGLRLSDQASLNQIINQTNNNAKSNRDAIMANMAARGRGGSGFDLAAQLAANQSDAQNASNQGLNVAAMAQDRALQALEGAGSMAGNMRNQQFGEGAQVAGAQDAIDRFNAQNSQSVINQNTANANQGQLYNVGQQQRIADQNTGLQNYQQQYNKGLFQQQFGNQMNLAGARAGQYDSMANSYDKTADQTANRWAGVGSAVGKGLTAMGDQNQRRAFYANNGGGQY